MAWLSGSRVTMTSALPSMSTATTWRSIQLQNHNRPSCQRGDSGIPRPVSNTFGSAMTPSSCARAAPRADRPFTPTRTAAPPIDTGPKPGKDLSDEREDVTGLRGWLPGVAERRSALRWQQAQPAVIDLAVVGPCDDQV